MLETPQETADRADRVMAKCRDRGQPSLADVENLKNGIHQLADDYESLLAVAAELQARLAGLTDEFGILDLGGGLRQAECAPRLMPAGNMAMAVELRAKGIFDVGGGRPARLMRRKVTGWVEIPAVAVPDDILPGYSARKATARTEADA